MQLEKNQMDVLLFMADDRRALIAAGKIQRWEVTKWVVTANFALATVSAATGKLQFLFLMFSILISLMGGVLLWHYNLRMTRVRASFRKLKLFVNKNIIDMDELGGDNFTGEKTTEYDRQEMRIFYIAVISSILPTLLTFLNSRI
jgi:hypothetical protein